MKLLSIAIPCYNSEAYMEKCIESLLKGGEEVEILVVNDGSSDRTAEIADTYAEKYPTIIKAIHQENGGHGEAVNAGIRNATGLYFKVVDSDDWVNEEAYKQILKKLEELTRGPQTLDMLISNFVYEKQGASRKKVMQYRHCLPVNEIFGWDSVHMSKGKYLLMHSIIYRTKLLHECGLELPKHTFYVDNIFVYQPLPHVKNMYYLDVNFYRYFIGRSDQSVNEQVMIGRIDQQLRVTKLMLGYYDVTKIPNRKLKHYMTSYLEIMMTICSVLAIKSGTEENMEKKKELWESLKKQNLPIEEKRTIDVKEIREWLNFIITIISVVLGVTNSSATTINNYNYTQQVNNYYIVGMGYDAKELNTTKYRIVNRESIVRLKHDCHSIVIEKLEEGKVVRIIDKYKKWRQIIWENEDGEECMGWIQNYRLTEFKVPRNK